MHMHHGVRATASREDGSIGQCCVPVCRRGVSPCMLVDVARRVSSTSFSRRQASCRQPPAYEARMHGRTNFTHRRKYSGRIVNAQ